VPGSRPSGCARGTKAPDHRTAGRHRDAVGGLSGPDRQQRSTLVTRSLPGNHKTWKPHPRTPPRARSPHGTFGRPLRAAPAGIPPWDSPRPIAAGAAPLRITLVTVRRRLGGPSCQRRRPPEGKGRTLWDHDRGRPQGHGCTAARRETAELVVVTARSSAARNGSSVATAPSSRFFDRPANVRLTSHTTPSAMAGGGTAST